MMWNVAAEFATEHRGVFVTIFVLPISLLYNIAFAIRAWIVFKFYSAPKLHRKRVLDIQEQIRKYRAKIAKSASYNRKLCTARGGWQSISPSLRLYKSQSHCIRVNLYDILSLDRENMIVHVEPMVNMGQLSRFLLSNGFTVPVLPEMDDLTVGGLLMGVGIETSSHKYGLFNDTVIEAEVVLANGDVTICSKTENRELFDALPWSYGTLGFLVSVKLRIVHAKSYVKIEYLPYRKLEDGLAKFSELSCAEKAPDFVEALQFSRSSLVVMSGMMVDETEVEAGRLNRLSLWYKPWFYKHVESFLESGHCVEYIPLRDYYHRHTRSIFWELEQIIPWGNNLLFRILLGWAVPPKVSFLKLTQTEAIRELYEKQHVIQDMLVPLNKIGEALGKFDQYYDLYPLWLCPYRAYSYEDGNHPHRCFLRKPEHLEASTNYEMYVDLGAYGVPRAVLDKKAFDIVTVSRKVEEYVRNVHGFQMLYADSYMTRSEFREMFDHTHYDAMKQVYDPERCFPEIFDKVCKRSRLLGCNETNKQK